MGLESGGRGSQAVELLFSLERSSKFSWLIIGMNNGSNENIIVLKYVNGKMLEWSKQPDSLSLLKGVQSEW